jgi:hypothetical protein
MARSSGLYILQIYFTRTRILIGRKWASNMTTPSNRSRCQTCQNLIAESSNICPNCVEDVIGNLESMYGKTDWSEWARDKATQNASSSDRNSPSSQRGSKSAGIESQRLTPRVERIRRYWWHWVWPTGREGIKVMAGWTMLAGPLAVGIPLLGPVVSETFGPYAPLIGLGLYLTFLLIMWMLIEIVYKVISR